MLPFCRYKNFIKATIWGRKAPDFLSPLPRRFRSVARTAQRLEIFRAFPSPYRLGHDVIHLPCELHPAGLEAQHTQPIITHQDVFTQVLPLRAIATCIAARAVLPLVLRVRMLIASACAAQRVAAEVGAGTQRHGRRGLSIAIPLALLTR